MRKLVIITGSNGALGLAYANELLKNKDFDVVTIARSGAAETTIVCDLQDKQALETSISKINFNNYSSVLIIHPVGKFKFEKDGIPEIDKDNDGIDDEVFASNVTTLENILAIIISATRNNPIPITVCTFGSISDAYEVPFWKSYSQSKNILRSLLRSSTDQQKRLGVLFVNVSSVNTGNENILRPFANKKYWLEPTKIVDETLPTLLGDLRGYKEISLYNPMPGFAETYFKNHQEILNKWLREMGNGVY